MGKIPFEISAKKQDSKTALVRIVGEIGWDVDAESFRREVDTLVGAGITDVHLYLNGPGGSCFDASEIVNILSAFTGKVTGEGGAFVASAYTYIAMHCETFTMPGNGHFMIHKPSGGVHGTAAQVLAYHKLLSDMETNYLEKYKARVKDPANLDGKWNAGDWWMTSSEALENGFITGIKGQAKINNSTAGMIAACGYPDDVKLLITEKNDMDLKVMAVALGMPENSTEEQVKARIDENKRKADELERVQRETREREQRELSSRVDQRLNEAIRDKRIKADAKEDWRKAMLSDFEGTSKMIDSIAPASSLGSGLKVERETPGRLTVNGKTFEQLQEEEPGTLSRLQKEDPETFDSLFADWKKRNVKH